MITEPAITTPNSTNNLPVIPFRNIIGRNTAARVIVVEMTVKKISDVPFIPASTGLNPSSTFL